MRNQRIDRIDNVSLSGDHCATLAKQELLAFVESVLNLLVSEQGKSLSDIWLDELAEMERTPEPISSEWRLVSIAAYVRLASRQLVSPAFLQARQICSWHGVSG